MRSNQTAASKFGVGTLVVAVSALAFLAGSRVSEEKLAAQARSRPSSRPPIVDEYYSVKRDWISGDRSILTIKHQPTASCYILVYPTGDALTPVEKERCAPPPAER